jgi:hypothetical protein
MLLESANTEAPKCLLYQALELMGASRDDRLSHYQSAAIPLFRAELHVRSVPPFPDGASIVLSQSTPSLDLGKRSLYSTIKDVKRSQSEEKRHHLVVVCPLLQLPKVRLEYMGFAHLVAELITVRLAGKEVLVRILRDIMASVHL